MSSTILINIKSLVNTRGSQQLLRGKDLADLPCINNAWLLVEDEQITGYGKMDELDHKSLPGNVIDATGKFVLPAWCDSHTHLVFAESREQEFIDKIKGLSYADIAARGGGILNSAKKLGERSEEELFVLAWKRLEDLARLGTGAVEIKSGYGLSVEGELKMLRVIKRLKEKSPLLIRSTFLAAHAFPAEFRDNHDGYLRMITDEMLPAIAKDQLADYIDVFCEKGFFSPAEMETVCKAGIKFGLRPKLHVNQLNSIGAVQKAIELKALTLDHLETMTVQDISDLSKSNSIGTLLPGAAFFLRMNYDSARKLVDAGAAIAIASDFNPGSSPSGNMNFILSLACIQLRLLPEEAINAATINGAYAMELENEVGSITIGKKANLILTQPISSLAYLPYSFGSNLVDSVMIRGSWVS